MPADPLLPFVVFEAVAAAGLAAWLIRELKAVQVLSAELLETTPDRMAPGLDLDGSRGLERIPTWARPVIDVALPARYGDFDLLGKGGMGVVLKAYDRELHRPVAVKVPPPHIAANPEYRTRFIREARALARLEHPNVSRIYDVPEVPEGECPVMVMEFLEGEDLIAYVKREGAVPIPKLLDWAEQAGAGLQYAHDQQLLHRDIKPANIWLDASGRIKILDFGLAAVGDAEALTASGVRMGTVTFMPPEQFRGEVVGPSVDQYALAVTLYFLATLKLPFGKDDRLRLEPKPISRFPAGVPESFEPVFARAMAPQPMQRYSSVREFIDALKAAGGMS